MKKLLFSLFTLSILFVVSACSSDDDPKVEKLLSDAPVEQIIDLVGNKDYTVETPLKSATLNELLKGAKAIDGSIYDGLATISKGDIQLSKTTLKIVGLPTTTTLKNFKININGLEHSFGDITAGNADLNIGKNTDFLNKAFERVMSSKKMESKVTFSPSETTTEDVKLEIILVGQFSYWVKQ
ncbi:hypothetical protein [Dysgonomonas massiliensis]|uniref:hypothetical protein n=1 Tax=Dysgonomonas massiliensis TaxID=2040292 RepID=UPI000C764FC2|nr:hypothetical protein [Dysgonomonas massiliensis]